MSVRQRCVVFGAYSDHDLYQRNRVLVRLIKRLCDTQDEWDFEVVRPAARDARHAFAPDQSLLYRLGRIAGDLFSLFRQRAAVADASIVFVPYPAYLELLLLKLCPKKVSRRIVADAFLELSSTVVGDRKLLAERSLRARALAAFQRFTLSQADTVLIDTDAQAAVLRAALNGCDTEVVVVPVGIDEEKWLPLPPKVPTKRCRVLFWGTFIPLHGIRHIVAAARILAAEGDGFEFRLLGDGQDADTVAADLSASPLANLYWERRLLTTAELVAELDAADIVLGVFGASTKAGAVIPYKVHQALASNRPVITRHGAAIEAFADGDRGLVVVPPADPGGLSQAVVDLWERINAGWVPRTRAVYADAFSHAQLLERLRGVILP